MSEPSNQASIQGINIPGPLSKLSLPVGIGIDVLRPDEGVDHKEYEQTMRNIDEYYPELILH